MFNKCNVVNCDQMAVRNIKFSTGANDKYAHNVREKLEELSSLLGEIRKAYVGKRSTKMDRVETIISELKERM